MPWPTSLIPGGKSQEVGKKELSDLLGQITTAFLHHLSSSAGVDVLILKYQKTLKFCQPLELLIHFKMGLHLLMVKIWGL